MKWRCFYEALYGRNCSVSGHFIWLETDANTGVLIFFKKSLFLFTFPCIVLSEAGYERRSTSFKTKGPL